MMEPIKYETLDEKVTNPKIVQPWNIYIYIATYMVWLKNNDPLTIIFDPRKILVVHLALGIPFLNHSHVYATYCMNERHLQT